MNRPLPAAANESRAAVVEYAKPVKPGPPPEVTWAPTSAWQPFEASRVSDTFAALPEKTVGSAGDTPVRVIGAGFAAEVCTVTVTVRLRTWHPVNEIPVREPMSDPLSPVPD